MERVIRDFLDKCGSRLDELLRRTGREIRLEDLVQAFHSALGEMIEPAGNGGKRIPTAWRLKISPAHFPAVRGADSFRAARDKLDQWAEAIANSGHRFLIDHRQSVREPIQIVIEEDETQRAAFAFVPSTRRAGLVIGGLVLSYADHSRPPMPLEQALSRQRVTLGRSAEAEIVVDHPSISRFHASLSYDEDGHLFLSDCGSANGTFVNGRSVTDRCELRLGDEVGLGSVKLRLGYEGFDTSAKPSPPHPAPTS